MSSRRAEFDEKTRVKRLHHAGFKCEGVVTRDDGETERCNAVLTRKRTEFDHDIAAELGGPATFDNCRALCVLCHRAKYPADAAAIAEAKRREVAHLGARRPKQTLKSAPGGLRGPAREHEDRQSLPPRSLYR